MLLFVRMHRSSRSHITRSHLGFSLFVLTFIFSAFTPLSPLVFAEAAPACIASPDTSTGLQGQPQTFSVLSNDTATPGATFKAESLVLSLVDDPIPGSTLSADQKTVTAPNEGTYTANPNGTITFKPVAHFLGKARGVRYHITDTKGLTITSIYIPTVTGAPTAPTACTTPGVEGVKLEERIVREGYGPAYTAQLVAGQPRNWTALASSANGMKLAASVYDGSIYTSTDGGVTWTEQAAAGQRGWQAITSSVDGMKLAAAGGNNGYIYTSTDGGVTWAEQTYPQHIDPALIDIDPATLGLQRTIDKTTAEGWKASYNPATDTYAMTITDHMKFYDTTIAKTAQYTLHAEGCGQPVSAPILLPVYPAPM